MADTPTFTLGAYLAKDPAGDRKRSAEPVSYPSDTLMTHGLIVGMTGSGKTGLAVVLIEEALSAGIPVLAIDPKGDLANLLLAFPGLRPEDFAPWVPTGTDPAATAEQWRTGLADWGIDPTRLGSYRDATRFTVYTPGSTAGVPLNVIGSLAPPATTDDEAVNAEVQALVTSLLGLVGITADPLASPEHILITNIVTAAWAAAETLDLPTLLTRIVDPPMRKLGVIELEQFMPKADRTSLMMKLNGLLASPAFTAWGKGAPLDIPSLLWDPTGRPSCSVVSIAHLSDDERQMVVSLLLSKVVTWMRSQPGTTQLRALVYMDEVFGFVPPSAMPPAKLPILTLFKQARAFGIGTVLATQNPVDVDYKAVSNAGTWMIGRLQTERDKARLMEGLTAASGSVDTATLDTTISGLDKREFLLHTIDGSQPRLFTTRWAMSYLAGPVSKDRIRLLPGQADQMAAIGAAGTLTPPAAATTSPEDNAVAPAAPADDEVAALPECADGVLVRWIDPSAPWAGIVGAVPDGRRLQAGLAVRIDLLYDDERADLRHTEQFEAILTPLGETVDPAAAYLVDYDDRDLRDTPPEGAVYALPDAPIRTKSFFTTAQSAVVAHLQQQRTLNVFTNTALKLASRPGEPEAEFRARCAAAAETRADEEADRLRARMATKADRLTDALQRAAEQQAQAQADAEASKQDELLGAGAGVLGALLGGRRSARSIAGAVRGAANRRARSQRAELKAEQYADKVADKQAELDELNAQLADEILEIVDRWNSVAEEVTTRPVPLERTDISVAQLALVWIPVAAGRRES